MEKKETALMFHATYFNLFECVSHIKKLQDLSNKW